LIAEIVQALERERDRLLRTFFLEEIPNLFPTSLDLRFVRVGHDVPRSLD
jgi:hypothetical protein